MKHFTLFLSIALLVAPIVSFAGSDDDQVAVQIGQGTMSGYGQKGNPRIPVACFYSPSSGDVFISSSCGDELNAEVVITNQDNSVSMEYDVVLPGTRLFLTSLSEGNYTILFLLDDGRVYSGRFSI